MNKDEWKALEMELQFAFGSAELLIDGFNVNLQVQQHKMRLVISVFVNGWMHGKWLSNKTEEATRFCRPVTFAVYKPSDVKRLTAGMSKSNIKKFFPGLDKKLVFYTSYWGSFSALKRHLIANNKVISLVKPEPEKVNA